MDSWLKQMNEQYNLWIKKGTNKKRNKDRSKSNNKI